MLNGMPSLLIHASIDVYAGMWGPRLARLRGDSADLIADRVVDDNRPGRSQRGR